MKLNPGLLVYPMQEVKLLTNICRISCLRSGNNSASVSSDDVAVSSSSNLVNAGEWAKIAPI